MGGSGNILIVDDDRALTEMLSEVLESKGYACSIAHNGREALSRERELGPDLVILDVMMPGDDGITTLHALRQHSAVPVLMLTAMSEEEDRILGLEAGADDYLAKPFVTRELELRVEAILRRAKGQKDPAIDETVEFGPLRIDPHKARARLGESILPLTGAELQILLSLAEAGGAVVSREDITRSALGRELTPYDRALDTHVSHLRRKLAKAGPDVTFEIKSVRGTGYRLVVD